jgi:hypothetical protein
MAKQGAGEGDADEGPGMHRSAAVNAARPVPFQARGVSLAHGFGDAAPASGRASLRTGSLFLLLVAVLAGCHPPSKPIPTPALRAEMRTPVVFVPGVTGSKLRERKSRRTVFGLGVNVLLPHDGGYDIAFPIDANDASRLEAFAVFDRVSFGFKTVEVFGPLIALLQANGYQVGDLDSPGAAETLFPFPYDWREAAPETARLLSEKLQRLRDVRGHERMPVALICQSTGAHVCRYLVKYGGASLEEAEAGRAGPLPWLHVTRLILIGTSNGGSMRTLRELHRGRRYVRLFGRTLEPEVFFSFRSLYQDLPCLRRDLFLDTRGRLLDVDLCDAASWERHGWSVYADDAARRLARARRTDLFGNAEERRVYLRELLEQARRFQRLLRRDVEGFGSTLYFMIQDASRDTPDRAVLVEDDGVWRTLFTGDGEIERRPGLRDLVTAAGDGHATVASQLWLSPQERSAMPRAPYYVEGGHFELIHDPSTRRHLLEALDESRP